MVNGREFLAVLWGRLLILPITTTLSSSCVIVLPQCGVLYGLTGKESYRFRGS